MPFPWPLPALAAWAAAWGVFAASARLARWPLPVCLALAVAAGCVCAWRAPTAWRRVFVAAGFPLSAFACGLAGMLAPGWWLLPLAALAWLYPVRTWRDAPLFPTPHGGLRGLAARVPLPARARILDAGCGLGDALVELQREYPQARLEGIEWSRPLRLACALRARFARVRRADLWASDWSSFDLVYVFQRPETMARIARKACAEMKPGSWLVSLAFEVPQRDAAIAWVGDGGRPVRAYRIASLTAAAGPDGPRHRGR
jgi:SAM-dependent methyltransferase